MKYSLLSVGVVALALSAVVATNAEAGIPAPSSYSFDETGNGRMNFAGGFLPVTGSLAPDPGPGGRASALTYQNYAPTNGSFVVGDLILTEPGGASDVIRFYLSSTIGYASLVFYSLPGGGQLADTGLPLAFYPNTFTLAENQFGPTSYTPTAGQPGYLSFFPGLTYFFTSSPAGPATVPEGGSSLYLLVLGLVALIYGRTRIAGVA